jgi:hypothetical protein
MQCCRALRTGSSGFKFLRVPRPPGSKRAPLSGKGQELAEFESCSTTAITTFPIRAEPLAIRVAARRWSRVSNLCHVGVW